MLKRGLGRAVLFLRNEPDTTRFRDTIRHACREDWRYDTQIEEDRAPYLFDVVHATGEPEYYVDYIRDALETIATPQELENTCRYQLIALAARLTKNGDGDLRDAIYRSVERTAGDPDGITGPGHVIVDLDGIVGYCFLVEQLIRFSAPDDESWAEISLLDDLYEQLGETNATDSLAALARDAPHLASYLNAIQQARFEENEANAARQELQKTSPPSVPTEAEIRAYLNGEHRVAPRGYLLDLANRERLAEELCRETDRERQIRYVRLFRTPAHHPFPGDPDILLALIRQTDNERLAWLTVSALEYKSHPAIRTAALEFLQTEHRVGHGVRLLPLNPGAEDRDLLEELVTREWDPHTLHSIGIGIRDYVERHADPHLIPVMFACYENMVCGFCRGMIVRELLKRNALPEALRAECCYDAYPNTRDLVKCV